MKEPVITLTLEEYEELRKERERLEKEHAEPVSYTHLLASLISRLAITMQTVIALCPINRLSPAKAELDVYKRQQKLIESCL